MRQIFGDIRWEKKLLTFFVLVGLLILLGPFGTYQELGFWNRSVFWVVIVVGVAFIMHITMTVALKSRALGKLPEVPRLFLGSFFGGFPSAAVVFFVNGVFRPPMMSAEAMPKIWLQVTAIGCIIGVFEYIDWRQPSPDVEGKQKIITKMHERLQTTKEAEIISMSMEDHYVNVTTSAGSEMVLLRFSEAIHQVASIPGLQIHRSHWVAATHLRDIKKRGNRLVATLSDGRTLPVSSTYAADAEAVLEMNQ